MSGYARRQLVHLILTPFATIGVLAAVLVWEIEHVGSILLAVVIAVIGVAIGAAVSRRLRRDIDKVADHYATLRRTADEQSHQAETANRLKDEFLATLSHELRTPLNSVLGWARLLASGKLDSTQTVHAVQAIERAGWAQSHVIEDLLDISRMVTGRLRLDVHPVDVSAAVETAVQSLRPASSAKTLRVEVSIARPLPPVVADRRRLQQVVSNLLSNAVKFTADGGRIDVAVRAVDSRVEITVTDTGQGIAPDVLPYIFDRFRQADSSTTRPYGGLGLGLAVVRHVVELHGGTVTATSPGPGRGSTFIVSLPTATR